MVPEFIRFYGGYTIDMALHEYAKTFFALLNSMYRIQAKESLDAIRSVSTGMSGKEGQSVVRDLEKQRKGVDSIIQEVKTLEQVRGK